MGISPRYSARTPPSSRTTLSVIPHIVRSCGENTVAAAGLADAAADEVWYAEDNAGRPGPGLDDVEVDFGTGIDAVAIERRERMRSKGYVVPTDGVRSTLMSRSRTTHRQT